MHSKGKSVKLLCCGLAQLCGRKASTVGVGRVPTRPLQIRKGIKGLMVLDCNDMQRNRQGSEVDIRLGVALKTAGGRAGTRPAPTSGRCKTLVNSKL